MKPTDEQEMHELAVQLSELTNGSGWEASRYWAIGRVMERLKEYVAVCDCTERRNKLVREKERLLSLAVKRWRA